MIRRRLRKVLPALSFHFGVKWRDIDEMPPAEIESYLDALSQIQSENRAAARRRR